MKIYSSEMPSGICMYMNCINNIYGACTDEETILKVENLMNSGAEDFFINCNAEWKDDNSCPICEEKLVQDVAYVPYGDTSVPLNSFVCPNGCY